MTFSTCCCFLIVLQPRIVVLGAEGTGKSTIVNRWLSGKSPLEPHPYEPTIEDRFKHTAFINGREQNVEIIDTSGADDMEDLRAMAIRSAHAFMLVYSVDSAESLAALRHFKAEVSEALGCSFGGRSRKLKIPMVLVGNKVDLNGPHERQVSILDGATMAKDTLHCKFVEVSGRTGVNVDEAFARLLKKLGDSVGSLSKATSLPSVSRSQSFLGRTIAAVRPKRRPRLSLPRNSSASSIGTVASVVDADIEDVTDDLSDVQVVDIDLSNPCCMLPAATITSC